MLRIRNLHKSFHGVHALNDASLTVEPGTVLALVGDNGAGKSTLMKCISGVLTPDSGSITFDEIDLTKGTPSNSRAAGIEMIYQDLSLCRLQDVVTNVFLGRENTKGILLDRRSMKEDCQSAFYALGIDVALDSIVGSLSGGQQQSIAIARAMLCSPKLLIMDEPTAALAVKETQKVLEHIQKVKEQGVSVIVITHSLSDVFEIADRIVVMRHGKIRYDLKPEETDIKDLTIKIMGE